MATLATKTECYDLYKNTYWGGFDYRNGKEEAGDTSIIANRNAFAREFNLKKMGNYLGRVSGIGEMINQYANDGIGMDHPESYLSLDGRIILVMSIYNHDKSPVPLNRMAARAGFYQYRPLYHQNATTWIAVFEDSKSLTVMKRELYRFSRQLIGEMFKCPPKAKRKTHNSKTKKLEKDAIGFPNPIMNVEI